MKNVIGLLLTAILTTGLLSGQNSPLRADKVLKDACIKAAAENKNVMIIFHASWCGWCRKLDATINDPSCKDFFDRNFVIEHLTVLESKDNKHLENPGANEMFEQNGGKGSGIPYFLIFDKNGKLLSDSKMNVAGTGQEIKMSNIGCPASEQEIAAFCEILKKTSAMTDAQVAIISKRFTQNRK
jgi:thiol-disulfide isomerase/thioredoxin